MSNDPVVAIVGVTGAVGAEFIATMDKRGFRVGKLKALASARSAGKTISFRGQPVVIEELTERAFDGVDIALFSAGSGISKKFAPLAVKSGAVVVDNSSAFRMDPNVPLVIPEINARSIRDHKGIIANPNCAAITALVPLWPIHQKNRIKRVIISTYQAERRGSCRDGRARRIHPRQSQRTSLHPEGDAASLRLQFVQPQHGGRSGDRLQRRRDQGHQGDPQDLRGREDRVGVTCVRVPVLRAHCEAITFECEKPITEDQVRAIMAQAPGVKIVDDRAKNYFPMPIDASGQDDVLVGRIRKDLSDPSGHSISMFVAADQLLKGAALNAVQIAELLPERAMA